MKKKSVLIIGAGLAGSEAATYLAKKGLTVHLAEAKKINRNPAQKMDTYVELVCTNSLKSMDPNSAHGLLKVEMDKLDSEMLKIARKTAVPAGGALAVDRVEFSRQMTELLSSYENITLHELDVENPLALKDELGADYVIVATGPLTNEKLETWIRTEVSEADFYFYDAIAPVVEADSLDMSKMYHKDRHTQIEDGVEPDYLNAPMNKDEYQSFIKELVSAEKTQSKDFEEYKFFESCLPVDVMAERGEDTARFSCMKPIGLEQADGSLPYACVQLRKENLLGSAYNLVGFQTRLTYKEQVRVFRMIPGLEEATFLHLGSVHRNSFLNARELLSFDMSSKKHPELYFAGQMTGVEGYTESAASGLYVAAQLWRKISGEEVKPWPAETAMGALINYVMTVTKPSPSNINFGLLPSVTLTKEQRRDRKKRKSIKKQLACERAGVVWEEYFGEYTL